VGDFGPWHLAIIAIVFVLLFGATRLPDGARSLGRSLRIFKAEIRGMHEDDEVQKAQKAQQAEVVPAPLPPGAPAQDPAPGAQVVTPAPPPVAAPVQAEATPQPEPVGSASSGAPVGQPQPPTAS
jgi:sec-independent protein translocase protein TatA